MEIKTIRISDKGQVALPIAFRKNANLHKGDKLIAIQQADKIILQKVKKENFEHLLKLSEDTARKLWDNEYDEIWYAKRRNNK